MIVGLGCGLGWLADRDLEAPLAQLGFEVNCLGKRFILVRE